MECRWTRDGCVSVFSTILRTNKISLHLTEFILFWKYQFNTHSMQWFSFNVSCPVLIYSIVWFGFNISDVVTNDILWRWEIETTVFLFIEWHKPATFSIHKITAWHQSVILLSRNKNCINRTNESDTLENWAHFLWFLYKWKALQIVPKEKRKFFTWSNGIAADSILWDS